MKKQTEQELREIISDARAKLDVFEKAERTKRNKEFLGRCFKYRNSYGSGSGDWWLYAKVTGDDGYWPQCFTFQVTSKNEVQFRIKDQTSDLRGWHEITPTFFKRELRKALKLVSRYATDAIKTRK